MSFQNNVVVGDAPTRLRLDGSDSPRLPRTVGVDASTATAQQDSGANFGLAQSERVVVWFYWETDEVDVAAADAIHLLFDKDGVDDADATDMAFPARTLFALVVSAKQPFFTAFSLVAGTLHWYAGA